MDAYLEFLRAKTPRVQESGFAPPLPILPSLFDWQALVTTVALRRGRCALFESCGLGKTIQQLEWARQTVAHTGRSVLILTPLAVAAQTVREGARFGIEAKQVRDPGAIGGVGIYVTNYERLELFAEWIPALGGVVLDESSILKSFDGKTRQKLTSAFAATPYKLCCTATPSPNDFTELGQHAEFLGICTPAQMLATYFINDTFDTGTWRLKKHAVSDFWAWVASWAICVAKPSDAGGDDAAFELPPLEIREVRVETEAATAPEGELFAVSSAL
ncbi:MAG: helicase, partial [Pararhizobium sp.]